MTPAVCAVLGTFSAGLSRRGLLDCSLAAAVGIIIGFLAASISNAVSAPSSPSDTPAAPWSVLIAVLGPGSGLHCHGICGADGCMTMGRLFLTAEWRYLAMLNYAVDPSVLKRWVPPGTELDSYAGDTFVSVVGFRFLSTKVFGLAFPFHRNFEEVNLGDPFVESLSARPTSAFIADGSPVIVRRASNFSEREPNKPASATGGIASFFRTATTRPAVPER